MYVEYLNQKVHSKDYKFVKDASFLGCNICLGTSKAIFIFFQDEPLGLTTLDVRRVSYAGSILQERLYFLI